MSRKKESATAWKGEVRLRVLRPTQMTIGYGEVAQKRREWRALKPHAAARFLKKHPFPAVIGPQHRCYVIDHHHLGRALIEEGVTRVNVAAVADLSHLAIREFWIVMDYNRWAHPYDRHGKRWDFSALPKRLTDLTDDPYRSLAAEVRRRGNYPKGSTPYSEFLWADFFRRRIAPATLAHGSDKAVRAALKLAREEAAAHLPGWLGPD